MPVPAGRGGSALDVAAFLGVCRVKNPERDRLLALCQDQYTPGWLQQHGSRLPKQPVTLINHEDQAVDERVTARLARQSLFNRDYPAQFTCYLHESALRLPVGGPAVMSDQLHHLLRMSVRSCVRLQVIPVSIGAHAATDGPFIFLEFAEFTPVVYQDSSTYCLFLEERDEITAYQGILAALAQTALSEEESRELIATLATELYADRADQDDCV